VIRRLFNLQVKGTEAATQTEAKKDEVGTRR
jgi:hypothetical protein